jgi:hypothetical protein
LCNLQSIDKEIFPISSELSSGSSDELQSTSKENKASSNDKTFGPKRKLPEHVNECPPKRGLSSGCSPGRKTTSPGSTLPSPLQLPDNISDDIIDILKNKPFHPKFYQARVTLIKKAREFFAGFCPYPSTQEYETMVLCIGKNCPHLSDPGVKESDSPRIKYVSLCYLISFSKRLQFHGRVDICQIYLATELLSWFRRLIFIILIAKGTGKTNL